MKSQKGISLVRFVILIIVLILITGIATYVAIINNEDTGMIIEKQLDDNTSKR